LRPPGLHAAFDFDFTRCRWNARAFAAAIERWLRSQPDDGWPCWVLGNHDQPRLATRFGARHAEERARVAAALLLTQRGTPFVYYGEEIGLPDIRLRRDQVLDPPGEGSGRSTGGATGAGTDAMERGTVGGFSTGTPWLPLHPGFPRRNVEAQRGDPRSVWSSIVN